MPHVDLGGVATYYEQHGAGEPLLLLHGGFCSLETMAAQSEALSRHHRVHAPERPGHGRTADRPGPMGYRAMLDDTVAYLDATGLAAVDVVGFSDGAILALMLALEQPRRLRSLVSISANLDPSVYGEASAGPHPVPPPVDDDPEDEAYLRLSPDGPGHRGNVLARLFAMWSTEPRIAASSLAAIDVPTLVLAGDRDSIPLEHTVEIYRALPDARLCVLPGAGHMAVRTHPEAVNRVLLEFLAGR